MNMKLKELKEELKLIAINIRKLKADKKEYQRGNGGSSGSFSYMISRMKWEYRHKHIVYCLLRGRTMEQIEKKNRPFPFGCSPDQNLIQTLKDKYEEKIICPCA